MKRAVISLSALSFLVVGLAITMPAGEAFAQATCRNKCNEEEQACLKRTGNKGQCGDRAKQCSDKCK